MNHNDHISASWDTNADLWTRAVRQDLIPSRRAGTDQAIVDAVMALKPQRVVDIGCGEGWLIRQLGCDGVGVDGSAALIEAAQSADAAGHYFALTYEDLVAQPDKLAGPYDVAIFNFSLLGEDISDILRAARVSVSPSVSGGAVLIQTLHPWAARGEGGYRNGWRHETFSSFASGEWQPMPWYYRTLETWCGEVEDAGLQLKAIHEPMHKTNGEPLSVIFHCAAI